MGYHDLSDSGMTAQERRNEATRILRILDDQCSFEDFRPHEQEFMDKMDQPDVPVSTKQLFWLRDLKEKYL